MNTYATAENILENVNNYIKELEEKKKKNAYLPGWANGRVISHESRYAMNIDKVYKELSIFDWWKDELSMTQLKDMKKFLETAIGLGYTGYVCFKVGDTGCANGMWAYKKESTNGYSPNGETLYKSFSPDYNYWSFCDENETWIPDYDNYNSIKTIKQLYEAIAKNK